MFRPPRSLAGQIIRAVGATKVDPNSLEQAVPTNQGDFSRLTLQNSTLPGTTMDQALTYAVPILDFLGAPVTLGYKDVLNFWLVAGEAPPADVRIWLGVSEGSVASNHRGMAVGLAYSGGQWLCYRAVNVAGSAWGSGAAASASSASTIAAKMTAVFGTNANQGQHCCAILNSTLGGINLAAGGFVSAMAMTNPAWTHVFIGADWLTGSGGSDGETIDLKGLASCMNLANIPNIA